MKKKKINWFKRFCCWMGWHSPLSKLYHDGHEYHATCKNCGKDLLMDSQGNWF